MLPRLPGGGGAAAAPAGWRRYRESAESSAASARHGRVDSHKGRAHDEAFAEVDQQVENRLGGGGRRRCHSGGIDGVRELRKCATICAANCARHLCSLLLLVPPHRVRGTQTRPTRSQRRPGGRRSARTISAQPLLPAPRRAEGTTGRRRAAAAAAAAPAQRRAVIGAPPRRARAAPPASDPRGARATAAAPRAVCTPTRAPDSCRVYRTKTVDAGTPSDSAEEVVCRESKELALAGVEEDGEARAAWQLGASVEVEVDGGGARARRAGGVPPPTGGRSPRPRTAVAARASASSASATGYRRGRHDGACFVAPVVGSAESTTQITLSVSEPPRAATSAAASRAASLRRWRRVGSAGWTRGRTVRRRRHRRGAKRAHRGEGAPSDGTASSLRRDAPRSPAGRATPPAGRAAPPPPPRRRRASPRFEQRVVGARHRRHLHNARRRPRPPRGEAHAPAARRRSDDADAPRPPPRVDPQPPPNIEGGRSAGVAAAPAAAASAGAAAGARRRLRLG